MDANPPPSHSHAEEPERLRAANAVLVSELEKTNQGVLALYAELDHQADPLRQASDLKSRLLSCMRHEFRTPLGSILRITRLLSDERDGRLNDEQKKQVRFVTGAVQERGEMVNDLLDLAEIEAGRISISPARFDMVDLFAAPRGMFRPILDGNGVDLIFEEPQGVASLYSDEKLVQILRNFISSTLKFTLRGEIRDGATMENPQEVRFSVSDPGIGIPVQLHQTLFADFVQVDSPLQKRRVVTGLGLSLCKRFAEPLGGRVGVESTPNVGPTSYVIVPTTLMEQPGHAS